MMVSVANVLVVVVCSAALAGVQGQVVHYGQCPDLPTQSAFNPARFITGFWYEAYRYPSSFESQSTCSVIDIKPSSKGMKILFHGLSSQGQSNITSSGSAHFDYGQLSKLIIEMDVPSWSSPKMKVRFWVMATDYKNYAVVWSCDPLEDCQGYRREQLWVLSRTPTLSDETWDKIDGEFFGAGGPFRSDYLTKVDQSGCLTLKTMVYHDQFDAVGQEV